MRSLILFDVDGTLVEGGPAKEAFQVAMRIVFGTAGAIDGHEFSGKTDPQIARELLRGAGLGDHDIGVGFPDLWRHYLVELEARLPQRPMRLLPGVVELIEALEGKGDVALALLTGNIARGAHLKLSSVGLDDRFSVGGFGSDREERNELPPVAIGRAVERWGIDFASDDVVVVGDTPRDVGCGLLHGTRTVAVATGRFDRDVLVRSGAHHTLDDLSRTAEVMDVLLG